jgi:uncharacterized protein
MTINPQLAQELAVSIHQINATVALLDEGATVPFIARYRKEATGGLDDNQLRLLEERLCYLRDLQARKSTILESITSQGKLTPELAHAINSAETKTLLEDLYLPYKPKRRTKAQIAREAGLDALLAAILTERSIAPDNVALEFINIEKGIADAGTALDGARQILMEELSENAALLSELRDYIWQQGLMHAHVISGKEAEAEKFKDYFDYKEPLQKIPSHRILAMFRGRNEECLTLTLHPTDDEKIGHEQCALRVTKTLMIEDASLPANIWLAESAKMAWRVKLFTRIDLDLKNQLLESAQTEAIRVFANNLRDLLLAAPAGAKVTMGLDPGIRTGVKVAIVDKTGKLLSTDTIYPHQPRNDWEGSITKIAQLIKLYGVELVSIGNGTASRETDALVLAVQKKYPDLIFQKIVVSEAGASVYSASELAAKEFPDIDVSLRGAVSIARRLQDPLAELVKIDPKSIGVGQYQHDVNQTQLARMLNNVVEDCVNKVGVDVNTASVSLLKQVSGLSSSVSENIVAFRNENGAFKNRNQLKKVPRLGEKAYEQAAGFLRILNGDNPLDASAVHPEAYPVIEIIIKKTGKSIHELIGQPQFLRGLNAANFISEHFGLPTVTDILHELEKPGRDPRPEFKSVEFKAGIEKITDLVVGMRLQGVITNVANFGAFVDIGVHQDGLIHISQLSDTYIKDPRDVVKAGDVVTVTVTEVDELRKRIALTMKQNIDPAQIQNDNRQPVPKPKNQPQSPLNNLMADAFTKALKSKKTRP